MERLEVLWNTVGQCRIPWQRPQRGLGSLGVATVISSLPLSVERYIEAGPWSALSGAVSVRPLQHRLHVRQKPKDVSSEDFVVGVTGQWQRQR